jgi:hypothetical protein
MPTIHTTTVGQVWGAGKALGQIEREKEAYTRGVEQAKLRMEQERIQAERNARMLAQREQEQRDILAEREQRYKQKQENLETQLKQDYLQKSNDIISRIQQEGDTPELRANWNRLRMEASMNGISLPDVYFPPREKSKTPKTMRYKTPEELETMRYKTTRGRLKDIYTKYKTYGEPIPIGLQREIGKYGVTGYKPERIKREVTPAIVREAEERVTKMENRLEQIPSEDVHEYRVRKMAIRLQKEVTPKRQKLISRIRETRVRKPTTTKWWLE